MKLLKGHLWSLTLHSFAYWKKKRTEDDDPIPYVAWNITRPYPKLIDGIEYEAKGTYLYPLIYRKYQPKEVKEGGRNNDHRH